jgi:MioC protein
MTHITLPLEIIVGSVLGATEYVADGLKALCDELGLAANVHFQPQLNELDSSSTWIVCSSTHGAGDLPDNIQPFYDELNHASLDNTYYLIGLGDSSYDTYCGAAEKLTQQLQNTGATELSSPLLIDVLQHPIPEDVAVAWLKQQLT